MKQREPDMVETLAHFIAEHGVAQRVLVASAQDELTARFRRLRQERGMVVPTSPGVRGILAFWLSVRFGVNRFARFDFVELFEGPAGQLRPFRDPNDTTRLCAAIADALEGPTFGQV